MAAPQPDRELRRHRHGGRHGAERQHAFGLAAAAGQILAQQFLLVQHAPRAGEHAFAFGRQAFVLAATPHDRGAELGFERTQRVRQGRLGDVTGQRGAAEVAVLLQGSEVAHRVEQIH